MRSGAWEKMRVNHSHEFVIGGYTVGGATFDAITFGRYEGSRRRLTRPGGDRESPVPDMLPVNDAKHCMSGGARSSRERPCRSQCIIDHATVSRQL
jgi:hypothetical protein